MTGIEVEITEIPPLSEGQTSLVDLHSLLNVLNILYGELALLGLALEGDANLLVDAIRQCATIRAELADPAASLKHAASLPHTTSEIERLINQELELHPTKAQDFEVRESVSNIHSVFQILLVRSREFLARAKSPQAWESFQLEAIRDDFNRLFAAIEKNSRGRFHIVGNLALQTPTDYFLNLTLESVNQQTVCMPPVFKDVMRDLVANARKYTALGGLINAGLYETEESLRFTIEDSGCGIPPEELQNVVHYGRRGSNVMQVRTMGGGFGLTKAFLVTKQFGGRFWIRSQLQVGTRITIDIPRRA